MAAQRKRYSAQDKIELLRLHLLEQVSVPEICERHKIHPTIFYRWQRQLFHRGHVVFQGRSPARLLANYRRKLKALKISARVRDAELQQLKQRLREKNSVPMALQKFAGESAAAVAYSPPAPSTSNLSALNKTSAFDETNSTPAISLSKPTTKLSRGITQTAQIETDVAREN